ncbi:MAG: hypothetical protein GVY20_17830 [Bacteroidetes bacterium]|jgi:hypothetical protein|nr:hypothetical protein [Bacteroidota bacterium]
MKKDWRYYEHKMDECFESGDKEQALVYKEKFIELYKKEQEPDPNKKKSILSRKERKKISALNTHVFDWNKFKEDYDVLLNSLEGYLKDKGYVVPVKKIDSPWELVDIVSERLFNDGKSGVLEDVLQRGDIKTFARLLTEEMEQDDTSKHISEIAKRISSKGSAKYDYESISLYLKTFVRYPDLSRNDLIDECCKLTEQQEIKDQLTRAGTVRKDWEDSLIEKLEPISPTFAQRLRR